MPTYKDDRYNTWFASFYYVNWQGQRIKKMKRGFATKKEAIEFERTFLQQQTQDLDMSFQAFYELYKNEVKPRLKLNTWLTKENIIESKILPYFKDKKMNEIKAIDVISWQNEMLALTTKDGKPFADTYKRTLHNHLSTLFNYAVKFYDLKSNPAKKAGNFGSNQTKEIDFWVQEEFEKFIDETRVKPMYYYAFNVMYWTGIRTGELLALTSNDFNFEKNTLTISKSYQRLKGEDVITEPKTPKSNRTINITQTLSEDIQEYIKLQYKLKPTDRLFPLDKNSLANEMKRSSKQAGVKAITLHSIRHSHCSLLIDLGFTAVAIADRLGHDSIDITLRYAHLFPSKQSDIVDRLEILQNGKKNT